MASSFTGWWRHLRLRARENIFDRIKSLFRTSQLIGWPNGVRALLYTFRRQRLDGEAIHPAPTDPRNPGALKRADPIPGGARFTFERSTCEVRMLQGGGAFIGWDGAEPSPSYALGGPDLDGPAVPSSGPDPDESARLSRDGDVWKVAVPGLEIEMDSEATLRFRDASGNVLRSDSAPRWAGPAWTHRSVLDSDSAVLGLGGRSTGLDRQGHTYRLWNTDPGGTYALGDDPLSMSIPTYSVVSGAGSHLAFYDNTFDGTIEVGEEIVAKLGDGPLRYYVFPGTPAHALERYTALTGRPALPPRWALGFHQCRWGYDSEAVVRRIADQFEEHELPISAIWLDIDHLVDSAPFMVDPKRYPDLKGLTAAMAERDIHMVVIADPGVAKRHREMPYATGAEADVFCRDARGDVLEGVVWPGWSVFPDFTAPRAREWWGGLYETYTELGIEGFWHDMNEPSSFVAWGDGTLPLSTRHELDGRRGDHREAHNVFALLLNHAAFSGVRRLRPDSRPFFISRSGYAGIQRYAGTWSGDIGTSWEGLRISLHMTLGLGLSGVPFSGPDVGGFDEHPANELYVRWFQLGSFLPFFRVHCAMALPHREPWALGDEVLAQIRPALRTRYELLPYWYTLAWEAHRTGAPYVRPMLWADPSDAALRWEDDQFLLGDALLVAPVLEEGGRSRKVRLPKGRWYDRAAGTAHDGPAHVTVDAPLSVTPVLVRAGAVVPVEHDGEIVLEAYPADPSDPSGGPGGRLVTDAGDGFDDPVEETFTVQGNSVRYTGPAGSLPYRVIWRGES